MDRMKISTSLNVLYKENAPVDDAIIRCRRAGFEALDFNYWDFQKYVLGLSWKEEEAWAQHAREVADREGAKFTQAHGPVHGQSYANMVFGLNEDSFLELAIRSMRTAAILGLPWVVFHATKVSPELETVKVRLAHNTQFYRKLFPVMEETGVGIALENLVDKEQTNAGVPRRNYCSEPEELLELIDTLNHPLVGACWDTGHANRQGLDQNVIRQFGKKLKSLHINDNNGFQDQHLLPYQGTVNWKAVMDSLAAIGYEGDFTYEAHRSIRMLPDGMKDAGLKFSAELATYLVNTMA
jgi:sugar phosphate isomerase/epimerase